MLGSSWIAGVQVAQRRLPVVPFRQRVGAREVCRRQVRGTLDGEVEVGDRGIEIAALGLDRTTVAVGIGEPGIERDCLGEVRDRLVGIALRRVDPAALGVGFGRVRVPQDGGVDIGQCRRVVLQLKQGAGPGEVDVGGFGPQLDRLAEIAGGRLHVAIAPIGGAAQEPRVAALRPQRQRLAQILDRSAIVASRDVEDAPSPTRASTIHGPSAST